MAVVARTINALMAKGRETVSLSDVQPHVQEHSRPAKVEEEERFRYQEINAVAESFYTVVTERNHLRVRPYPALSVVSMRYTLTNHTLDHAPSIRVGRFHQKRTCPDRDPCSLPIHHRSF